MTDSNTNAILSSGAKTAIWLAATTFRLTKTVSLQLLKFGMAQWQASTERREEARRRQEIEAADQARAQQERRRLAEASRVKHRLTALRCKVTGGPRKYRRPNVDGSRYFEGTELDLMNAYEGTRFELSFEGLYGFATQGDIIDIVLCSTVKQFLNLDVTLPVLVINRARGGYHLIDANIDKNNDDALGGEAQLRADLRNYSVRELNITFET